MDFGDDLIAKIKLAIVVIAMLNFKMASSILKRSFQIESFFETSIFFSNMEFCIWLKSNIEDVSTEKKKIIKIFSL